MATTYLVNDCLQTAIATLIFDVLLQVCETDLSNQTFFELKELIITSNSIVAVA